MAKKPTEKQTQAADLLREVNNHVLVEQAVETGNIESFEPDTASTTLENRAGRRIRAGNKEINE